MLSAQFTDERVAKLMAQSRKPISIEEREVLLNHLVALYDELVENDEKAAQELRQAFLLFVEDDPNILAQEKLAHFFAEHVRAEDFAALQWKTPHHVGTFCETLYGFQFEGEAMAEKIASHVHALLRHALHHFEQRGEYEKMFQLLQIAPISHLMTDLELLRLRNRAYFYEMRRVQRRRRILYGYLMLQVLLIAVVFPFLFIYAENGAIQSKIEEVAKVDLPREVRRQYFSYADGLYWSLITAGSIGYGDITPVTRIGKIIAATLGIMGVITIGVIAGLIFNWITPRRLN